MINLIFDAYDFYLGPFLVPQKQWKQPQPLPDVSFPPREHDIDRLELELGKTPITRDRSKLRFKKPKIIILSKTPQFIDLMDKSKQSLLLIFLKTNYLHCCCNFQKLGW